MIIVFTIIILISVVVVVVFVSPLRGSVFSVRACIQRRAEGRGESGGGRRRQRRGMRLFDISSSVPPLPDPPPCFLPSRFSSCFVFVGSVLFLAWHFERNNKSRAFPRGQRTCCTRRCDAMRCDAIRSDAMRCVRVCVWWSSARQEGKREREREGLGEQIVCMRRVCVAGTMANSRELAGAREGGVHPSLMR